MKKLLSLFAITLIFCACNKTDLLAPIDEDINPEVTFRGKKGAGGGMTVTTDEASYILPFGAVVGGSVSSGGGGNGVTERGVCFGTSTEPTTDDETAPSGSGSGNFTSVLSGLDSGMSYYARAYAIKIKNNGTITITYGNEVSFDTPAPIYGDDVTDIDGNIYTTIKIGTQWWMVENLKTTKYRDGTPIPNVSDDAEWESLSSGAYCNYDNDPDNSNGYGRLYNSNAASNSLIAPTGWHVPSLSEFFTLANYLGTGDIAGGRMKETGFNHWSEPNTGGDNSSGFNAVGAGKRLDNGIFGSLGNTNIFWTSYSGYKLFHLSHDSGSWGYASGTCVPASSCLNIGGSVRLIKD